MAAGLTDVSSLYLVKVAIDHAARGRLAPHVLVLGACIHGFILVVEASLWRLRKSNKQNQKTMF